MVNNANKKFCPSLFLKIQLTSSDKRVCICLSAGLYLQVLYTVPFLFNFFSMFIIKKQQTFLT